MNAEAIKERLDIVDVAEKYCELQKFGNVYKARENPVREENTSSLYFYPDTQKYYDFGCGAGGDVIDFVAAVENISLSDVMSRLRIGESTTAIFSLLGKREKKEIPAFSQENLSKEFNYFERIDIGNPNHSKELFETVPEWLYNEAGKKDRDILLSIVRFDQGFNTLVAGWFEHDPRNNRIMSYKRRRLYEAKWANRYGTHPNKTVMNRISKANEPIYIVEGARDALTAILLGVNVVAIPTASFGNIDALKWILTPLDELIMICEDEAGFVAMKRISSSLPGFNTKLITLSDDTEKVDLTDFAYKYKTIQEVLNGLRC